MCLGGNGTDRRGRGEDRGVEGKEEASEETEANMADWMCHSRSVGWPPRAVTPAYKSALKMALGRSSIAPVTT